MPKFVLHNVRMFAGGADLTTVSNKVELTAEGEDKETTAFAPTGGVWRESLTGIRSTSISASGQWEAGNAGNVDDNSFASLGNMAGVSVCPTTAADGSLAWLSSYVRQNYMLGGAIGDVAPWSGNFNGAWPLVRGSVLATSTARSATGTGTAFQLGAVPAGKSLYAAVHVMSVAGTTPSLTVKVQADNAVGFPSPIDALTFTAQNSIGGQIMRLPGPLADDWFRASWTITGTGPSFLFLVTAGIA